jgi:hypothetical protein
MFVYPTTLFFSLGDKKNTTFEGNKARLETYKFHLAAVYLLTIFICVVSACLFWYPRVGLDDTFVIFSVYFGFKSTSVLTAFAAVVIGQGIIAPASTFVVSHLRSYSDGQFAVGSREGRKVLHRDEQFDLDVLRTRAATAIVLSGYSPEVLGFGDRGTEAMVTAAPAKKKL